MVSQKWIMEQQMAGYPLFCFLIHINCRGLGATLVQVVLELRQLTWIGGVLNLNCDRLT